MRGSNVRNDNSTRTEKTVIRIEAGNVQEIIMIDKQTNQPSKRTMSFVTVFLHSKSIMFLSK